MLFSNILLLLVGSAAAVPFDRNGTCKDPVVRQEWRQLPEGTRQSYLEAVKCLKTMPSRLGLETSLYDDFPYVHAHLNTQIHFVAAFLPWHRYFLHLYEKALQGCGYNGVAPELSRFSYWDWTLDVASIPKSPIWDANSGFGGNGLQPRPNGSSVEPCVHDGPFKDLRVEYLQLNREEHCLRRNWNDGRNEVGDMLVQYYTPEVIAACDKHTDYNSFHVSLEGGPHGAVHSAIGGDMSPSTSPNDPIFFLHHCQIDRLWTVWQAADPEKRTLDYSGYKTQNKFNGTIPPPASLEDMMPMLGFADDVPVKDFMSTESQYLCYRY